LSCCFFSWCAPFRTCHIVSLVVIGSHDGVCRVGLLSRKHRSGSG
jgi:hypothetical protein